MSTTLHVSLLVTLLLEPWMSTSLYVSPIFKYMKLWMSTSLNVSQAVK